jgi:hypothetical protein
VRPSRALAPDLLLMSVLICIGLLLAAYLTHLIVAAARLGLLPASDVELQVVWQRSGSVRGPKLCRRLPLSPDSAARLQ